jgi:hypothetical protein
MLRSPNQTDHGSVRQSSRERPSSSRRNSISSFLSIRTVDGENPPGHYVVVYDTLEKRIYLESHKSVEGSSDCLLIELPLILGREGLCQSGGTGEQNDD